MLKRKVSEQLTNWIKTKDRKCLIVQGARQAGKTYAIERFAENNYEETIEINFKETPACEYIELVVNSFIIPIGGTARYTVIQSVHGGL